ncbi:MAG: PIG-L deacetylase family protein [Actinomycetota bacterium]
MNELDFQKVLIFFAHPDDGEFMAGGSSIKWAAEGKEVVLCVVTNGSHGSNDPAMVREELIAARMSEQRAAAQVTGISDVVFLGYEDCHVEDSHELRRDMIREIRRHKPDLVIGPDPTTYFFHDQYINHPDHRKVGEALCAAISPGAATLPVYREELFDKGFEPHHLKAALFGLTGQPNYFVDITGSMDTKIRSVLVHYSQTPEFGDQIADRIKGFARDAGQQSEDRFEYAESYRAIYFRER